ncbi:TIGR03016 family PEP-CTERM system-associated outer membrane protein [Kordiimonas lipolytica]|uniref:TIGR03016 family PEP-CTERM system-associated outer membrane protein n=1 Tax=Kordiimonas lipolytica TaxID=1662421 RepID=A0ABV8UGD6_9PROT|nr:TIGR03016 family PEP-CTERM system-associated outer membrane protein [Kordiimonas lipolytica]
MGAFSGNIRIFRLFLLGALALCLGAELGALHAQHIWFDPRVEAKLAFSDNSLLSEGNRQADTVLNFAPGLNTRIEGRKLRGALDYSYDYLRFLSDGSSESRHNLFGTFDMDVWEDHLTVNSRASLRQVFLDRGGSLSKSIANKSTNRRLVQSYTGSAILKGTVRNYADWRISYRYGLTLSPADNLADETITTNFSDTQTHEVRASIGSGQRFNNLEWRLYASSQRSQRSLDVNDFRTESAGAELQLKFNRHFSLIGSLGYAQNGLQTQALAVDGMSWETGFRLTPGSKLDLTMKLGKEGNRTKWYGRLQHFFSVRLDLVASYTDTITSNAIVLNDTLQSLQFDPSRGIIDTQGLPVDETDPSFSLSDVDFRRRNASAVLTWRHKRSQLYLNGNMEWRTFDDNSGTASSWGVSTGFKRQVNKNTDLSGTISYRRSRFEDGVRVDNYFVGSLDWSKRVSKYFTFSVNASHSQRQSNEQGSDLMENALTLYLRGTF